MFLVKSIQKKANLYGWLLMIPTVISILMFIVYPVIFSIIISFTNMSVALNNLKFIGLTNYQWIFSSAGIKFWQTTWVSIKFTFASTAIQTILGFLLAYVLYNMHRRVQGVYKVLMYIPVLLPAPVVSVMWSFFFEPNIGLMDRILAMFGVQNFPFWITDPNIAIWTIIAVNTWRYIGVTMIIYFIAMNAIPKDIVEGARIDGANKGTILWRIILPLTWSSTATNLLLSVMGGLKSFELFYLFTNGKGSNGLDVVGLYIWRVAFGSQGGKNLFCRSVTMSIVLSVIIGTITLSMNRLLNRQEAKIND